MYEGLFWDIWWEETIGRTGGLNSFVLRWAFGEPPTSFIFGVVFIKEFLFL